MKECGAKLPQNNGKNIFTLIMYLQSITNKSLQKFAQTFGSRDIGFLIMSILTITNVRSKPFINRTVLMSHFTTLLRRYLIT